MILKKLVHLSSCLIVVSGLLHAQTNPVPTTNTSTQNEQFEYVKSDTTLSESAISNYSDLIEQDIDVSSGTLSLENAGRLLSHTVCNSAINPSVPCALDDRRTYALINVIRWGEPDANNKQSIASSNWYVFNSSSSSYFLRNMRHWSQADFSGNNRLYGVKQLIVLFIHVNIVKDTKCGITPYAATYEVDIQKRTPTYQADFIQLAQIVIPGSQQNTPMIFNTENCPVNRYNLWGGRAFAVGFSTSNLTISSTYTDPAGNQQPASLAPNYKLLSEARSYGDVSIAVPVKKISGVQYSGTGSDVVPSQINRQNSFAVLDAYLIPVDLAGSSYNWVPHPLVGVSMAQQPLHSVLAALGAGTHFGEIFVGFDFLKQQSDFGSVHNVTKGQFAVGINIPINGAYQSLKKTQ